MHIFGRWWAAAAFWLGQCLSYSSQHWPQQFPATHSVQLEDDYVSPWFATVIGAHMSFSVLVADLGVWVHDYDPRARMHREGAAPWTEYTSDCSKQETGASWCRLQSNESHHSLGAPPTEQRGVSRTGMVPKRSLRKSRLMVRFQDEEACEAISRIDRRLQFESLPTEAHTGNKHATASDTVLSRSYQQSSYSRELPAFQAQHRPPLRQDSRANSFATSESAGDDFQGGVKKSSPKIAFRCNSTLLRTNESMPGVAFDMKCRERVAEDGVDRNHTTFAELQPGRSCLSVQGERDPYVISLKNTIQAPIEVESRIQFAVDRCVLEEIGQAFGLDKLAKQLPIACKIHEQAWNLLQQSRLATQADQVENLVVFVDGSYFERCKTCSWAIAVFDSRPHESIWWGYMAGLVSQYPGPELPSAFKAEMMAQLVAHLVCVAQPCKHITVVFDATSAASVAAGDCSTGEHSNLARQVAAAGILVRNQGKTIRQVHTKSHAGHAGNELVDGLASYVSQRRMSLCHFQCIFEEELLEWMWVVARPTDDCQLPQLAEDGAFPALPVCKDVSGAPECPEQLRPLRLQKRQEIEQHELSTMRARFMTYNTLPFRTPGQAEALVHEMRRLGVSVLALQECREGVETIRFSGGVCKIAGPALHGQLGCQVWVDCDRPVGDGVFGAKLFWNRK